MLPALVRKPRLSLGRSIDGFWKAPRMHMNVCAQRWNNPRLYDRSRRERIEPRNEMDVMLLADAGVRVPPRYARPFCQWISGRRRDWLTPKNEKFLPTNPRIEQLFWLN